MKLYKKYLITERHPGASLGRGQSLKRQTWSYKGEGHQIGLKGFDSRYADQSGLNILHKLVRFPELADMKVKFKITIEVK